MALSLGEANRVVEGAIAAASEMGIKINVAVVDAGGRLIAFNRMDGAIWAGVYGSQGKAAPARPSGAPAVNSRSGPAAPLSPAFSLPKAARYRQPGGFPLSAMASSKVPSAWVAERRRRTRDCARAGIGDSDPSKVNGPIGTMC